MHRPHRADKGPLDPTRPPTLKQKWGDLTDDEIDRVEGRQEELAGLIQKKYGKTREEAQREVDEWAGAL